MKIRLLFLFLPLLLATACKKDSDEGSAQPDVYVRAVIDGQKFSVGPVPGPNSTTGSYALFSQDENKLFIYGTGPTIYLALTVTNFPKQAGTYPLGDANQNNVGAYTDATNPNNSIIYLTQNGRTGSLTVTSFDGKTMIGTFSYTAYNSQQNKEVQVLNGEFKVPYTEF